MKQGLAPLLLLLLSCASTRTLDFVQGPAGRLRIDDGGRGPSLPVVFIHGNGANRGQWSAQLAHLRPSRRAIAYDLRGMGESEAAANSDYGVPAMVADLEAVTKAAGMERFVLVAHSFGGAVAAGYAAAHPGQVAGVVFVDSAGSVTMTDQVAQQVATAMRADKTRLVRQWFAAPLAPSTEEVRATVLASVDRTEVTPFLEALLGMRKFDMGAALSAYPGPCVAIAAVAIEQPSSFHKQFSRCPVAPVEKAGHWVMLDRPAEVNRLLDTFLASLR